MIQYCQPDSLVSYAFCHELRILYLILKITFLKYNILSRSGMCLTSLACSLLRNLCVKLATVNLTELNTNVTKWRLIIQNSFIFRNVCFLIDQLVLNVHHLCVNIKMFKVLQYTTSGNVTCGNMICVLSLRQVMEMKWCLRFIHIFMVTNENCMYLLVGNLSGDI